MFKVIIPSALLVILFVTGCATQNTASKSKSKCHELAVGTVKKVRTTAYTHTEAGGRHTAIGTRLCDQKGEVKSAAADWSRFPLGTKFQIVSTGETYEICDYGSALVGKDTIDLYKGSRKAMRAWGVRYVDIKILRWGSPLRSLQVLSPRYQYKHIRAMLVDLRQQT